MVHSVVALRLVVPFQQREVDDPQRSEYLGIAQTQLLTHFEAQGAELHARLHSRSTEDKHQVARLGAELLGDGLLVVLRIELVDRALERAVGVVFDVDHSAGAHLRTLDEVGQRIELLASIFGAAFGANAHNQFSIVEQAETFAFGHIVQLHKLHTETDIRLVAAIAAHSVVPRDARKLVERQSFHFLEEVLSQPLKSLQHILLLHERHLAVDLRKLRLAVRTQVLVAEAAHNLEIAVHTGHHQQLLVLLRTLRQGIELARIHTARHHEVAGAFGGRLDKHRRLYFEEIEVAQVVAHQHSHTVAQLKVAAHRVAAYVEVTVFHTQVVAAIALVLNGKGRRLGLVEHRQFLDVDFDFAGRNLRVLAAALDDNAFGLQHIFAPQSASLLA